MQLLEAVRQRRSVKQYDPHHQLSETEIRHLLGHTLLAPTSFNMQNWHFVVATDPAVQEQLCAASWNQAQVIDCSATILLIGKPEGWKDMSRQLRKAPEQVQQMFGDMIPGLYADNQQLQHDEAVRSVSLAGATLMLVAKDMGLDTCPMIGYDPSKVVDILGLPEGHLPLMMVTVGKAAQTARPRMGLFDFEEVVSINRYGNHTLIGEVDDS
jgi:nitroreductase